MSENLRRPGITAKGLWALPDTAVSFAVWIWGEYIQSDTELYLERTQTVRGWLDNIGLSCEEHFLRDNVSSLGGAMSLMSSLWLITRAVFWARADHYSNNKGSIEYRRAVEREMFWEEYGRLSSALLTGAGLLCFEAMTTVVTGSFHSSDLVAYTLAAGFHVLPDLPGIVSARLTRER